MSPDAEGLAFFIRAMAEDGVEVRFFDSNTSQNATYTHIPRDTAWDWESVPEHISGHPLGGESSLIEVFAADRQAADSLRVELSGGKTLCQ